MNVSPSAGQPPPRSFSAHTVKVTLPADEHSQASIRDKDGKVTMMVPAGGVSKRFARGERVGYFKAELDASGILELGERLANLGW